MKDLSTFIFPVSLPGSLPLVYFHQAFIRHSAQKHSLQGVSMKICVESGPDFETMARMQSQTLWEWNAAVETDAGAAQLGEQFTFHR